MKLLSVAGAYWRGSEKNKMLQRIYGITFPSEKELKEHLQRLEEAKRRDHRKLGQELELFMLTPNVGGGLPIWLPKGTVVRESLEQFLREEQRKRGYLPVELRPAGTWLSPEMRGAYLRLHKLGFAHCVETWQGERLVGGLYGVALGRVFFGESMFSMERDASKVALKRLCDELVVRGYRMIDCQMATPHLLSLGAQLLPRHEFIETLAAHVGTEPTPERWMDATPAPPAQRLPH